MQRSNVQHPECTEATNNDRDVVVHYSRYWTNYSAGINKQESDTWGAWKIQCAKYLSFPTNQSEYLSFVCKNHMIHRLQFSEACAGVCRINSYGFVLLLIQASISCWGSVSLDSSWHKALYKQKIAADNKPAWSQMDMERNYLKDWMGKYFTHFTDLLKANQNPHNSFSYRGQVEFFFYLFSIILFWNWKKLQQLFCTATYVWCNDVNVVNTEIMGYQCCCCVLSHVSPFCSLDHCTSLCGRTSHSGTGSLCLCKLKRVLSCAVFVSVCVCLPTSACLARASA